MIDYQEFIKHLSQTKENRIFLNTDKEHAIVVLSEIFRSAKKIVRIFAASLCNEVGGSSEYIESLSDFIENNGELRILLNSYKEDDLVKSNLFKRLAYYESLQKSISVKHTETFFYRTNDPDKKEVHFTIGDEHAFRIETDTDTRTATCNLNDTNRAKDLITKFDKIFDDPKSQQIRLLDLFKQPR